VAQILSSCATNFGFSHPKTRNRVFLEGGAGSLHCYSSESSIYNYVFCMLTKYEYFL